MRRVEDWPERLLALIDSRRDLPFAWGENDCCTFAFDAVKAMTGVDPMADWRGRYDSAPGVAREMVRRGFKTLAEAVDAAMPEVLSSPRLAQRGDVVMFDALEGPALAVVVGAHAAGVGPQGVTWVQMDQWTRAWKVGGIV